MNRLSPSEATEAVALALAFHRAPARHADLLHGVAPLPDALGLLLRMAGDLRPAEVTPAIAALAPPNELRAAALFFVEQVLFRHDANHYRVLGLNPGAGLEQIKEHHRLLMRLFHPDREGIADDDHHHGDWTETYATRANLAYNTLRDADSRSHYLAGLKAQTANGFGGHARHVSHHPGPRPDFSKQNLLVQDSFWAIHIAPRLVRYMPQWVLGGTALLALTVVGVIYQTNPPFKATQQPPAEVVLLPDDAQPALPSPEEQQNMPLPVVADATDQAAKLDAAIAQFENREKDVARLPASVRPVRQAPVQRAQPRPAAVAAPTTVSVRVMPRAQPRKNPADLNVWVKVEPTPASPPQGTSPKELPGMNPPPETNVASSVPAPRTAPAVLVASTAVVQPVLLKPSPVETPTLHIDPNVLLARLAEAYERGDTENMMSLFDERARTDAGGWPETRRDLDALFKGTELRNLKIESVAWSGDGDQMKGQGRYRMTHMRKGELVLKTQSGAVRIELVRRGQAILIASLFYSRAGHL